MVSGLDEAGWRTPTPAAGWDVATQVAHLAWTDDAAFAAATDKQAWDALVLEAIADPEHAVDTAALAGGAGPPGRAARPLARRTGAPGRGAARVPRRAEDAVVRPADVGHLDGHRPVDGDLGALARRARGPGSRARGQRPDPARRAPRGPHPPLLLRRARRGARRRPSRASTLTAPSGDVWTWGPEEGAETVTGPAYDFCLLVTQRVHRADTALVATGPGADRWLDIAQCFAGPPGEGRSARG